MTHPNSPYRWVILGLLFISIFSATIAMNCMPPLFKEIGTQIPLTKAQMGTVMGMLTLASLFFAPIGGGVSDRIGARLSLGFAVIIIAAGSALRASAGSAAGLTAWMFVMGAGIAVYGPNMPKALGMWFPGNELGMVTGICMAGMGIGGAVSMATSANILSPAFGGWRATMVALGGVNLAMALLWFLLFRERSAQPGSHPAPDMLNNFKKVFRVKDIWLLAVFYGLNMAGLMTIVSLLPVTLAERGMERGGEMVAIMMGTAVIFNIAGGVMSDRLGRRKPFLLVSTLVLGLCIAAFSAAEGAALIIALILAGAAMGTIAPVMMIIPVELESVGPALTATAVGLIFMVGNTGGFIGPVVSGRLMDGLGAHWPGFLAMAAALILAAVFVMPLRETGRKKNRDAGIGE